MNEKEFCYDRFLLGRRTDSDESAKYEYRLQHDVCVATGIKPGKTLVAENYIYLGADGMLRICKGYAWDGASYIPDTLGNMFASLVHDALYQLMRREHRRKESKMGDIEREEFRKKADKLFREHWNTNGHSDWWQRFYVSACYRLLRWGGRSATLWDDSRRNEPKEIASQKVQRAPARGSTECPDNIDQQT